MELDNLKKKLAKEAIELIKNGMTVGLGTGSTANFFIEGLINKVKNGLKVQVVCSSENTYKLAKEGKLNIVDINDVSKIDITIDGADAIDPKKNLIKGGGGALFKEKILANSSNELVILADETKLVENLSEKKLPIEVMFYGFLAIKSKIDALGYTCEFRQGNDDILFITDNSNLILDITFSSKIQDPQKIHNQLINIPGVVETGFFFNMANKIIVAHLDERIEII
jgi:ribose 5-phosphate isomerase A